MNSDMHFVEFHAILAAIHELEVSIVLTRIRKKIYENDVLASRLELIITTVTCNYYN